VAQDNAAAVEPEAKGKLQLRNDKCRSASGGMTSGNAIAGKLNERNVPTARGGKWTHMQVGAILRPFGASASAA
jgi:hypothetical protein